MDLRWLQSLHIDPKLLLLTPTDTSITCRTSPGSSGSSVVQSAVTRSCADDFGSRIFPQLRFSTEIEPAQPDFFLSKKTPSRESSGSQFQVLEVPGHCPGSLCFFLPNDRLLIGGDVLFAGSIGPQEIYQGDIDC